MTKKQLQEDPKSNSQNKKKAKKYTRTNNIWKIVGIQNCLNRIGNLFTVIDLRW